mgnify:FL=1
MSWKKVLKEDEGETPEERADRIEMLDEVLPEGYKLIANGKYKSWQEFNDAVSEGEYDRDDIDIMAFLHAFKALEETYKPKSYTKEIKRLERQHKNAMANLPRAAQSKLEEKIRQLKEKESR